jgi:hypothetical protein
MLVEEFRNLQLVREQSDFARFEAVWKLVGPTL